MVTTVIEQEIAQESLLLDMDRISLSETNKVYRKHQRMTREELQELTDSIKQVGVVQAITVRPNPLIAGHFILISGERRFRASKFAGCTTIPAYIKDVDETKAEIMQATENIQRKDIHPLDEAKAYALLLEKDPTLSIAELARQLGKPESYVPQRLKLNGLIRDAQNHFYEGLLTFGHALIIARLPKDDQKQIIEQYVGRRNGYGTVNDLQQYVEHNLVNTLATAAFDKKDAELYPKAGACTTCEFRSGASPLLFPDMKKKDQCLNRQCFFHKCKLHLMLTTKKVIETQPDVVFLTDHNKVDEEINKILTEYKITPLREYDDFHTDSSQGKKVSGLWICGTDAGKIETVSLKKEVKELSDERPSMKIQKIEHRMERGKELDEEKVYAKILESLTSHPSQKKNFSKKLMPDEEVMLWFIIYDKASYHITDELERSMGMKSDKPEKMYEAIRKLKAEDKAYLLRRVMMDQYGGNYPRSLHGFIMKKIAASYGDIDITGFEKEQGEIASKRETRAQARIKDLQLLVPKTKNNSEKSNNKKGA